MRSLTGITILLTLGVMSDAKTTQPKAMESNEEEPVHLPCNHSTISGSEYIHWYRQTPHQGPEYMIHGLKDNVTNGMVSLTIANDRKSSTLTLARVTLRDAAVYYCIARDAHWHRWGHTCTRSAWRGMGGRSCHLVRPLHKNEQEPRRGGVEEKRGRSKAKTVRKTRRKE
uniref:Ig-like domain-containing protein n=1 Tax=Suricata suricatta TaxID=37032 RepID=A0A673T989_SURSU